MSLLDTILQPGGMRMLCQPIFRLARAGPCIDGIECLARGPLGTPFESPNVLFDYVRRKQAEDQVDQYAIELALSHFRDLSCDMRLAINVHASTLARVPNFTEYVDELAERHDHSPERVTMEIVEHTPATNLARFAANLQALRRRGYRIALDDVGVGHSNFKMILDAHPDYFKIDSYLVQGASRDEAKRAVLNSILTLAHRFGSSVIAEGVEEPADLQALQALGVEMVQGYLLSPPITREELYRTFLNSPRRPHAVCELC